MRIRSWIDSYLFGYELNGYADKADERGFKKLRYTIINNKLKSAFVRLVRVVRVSIHSLPYSFNTLEMSRPPNHLNFRSDIESAEKR